MLASIMLNAFRDLQYYAQNYAGIIGLGLLHMQWTNGHTTKNMHTTISN